MVRLTNFVVFIVVSAWPITALFVSTIFIYLFASRMCLLSSVFLSMLLPIRFFSYVLIKPIFSVLIRTVLTSLAIVRTRSFFFTVLP